MGNTVKLALRFSGMTHFSLNWCDGMDLGVVWIFRLRVKQ